MSKIRRGTIVFTGKTGLSKSTIEEVLKSIGFKQESVQRWPEKDSIGFTGICDAFGEINAKDEVPEYYMSIVLHSIKFEIKEDNVENKIEAIDEYDEHVKKDLNDDLA